MIGIEYKVENDIDYSKIDKRLRRTLTLLMKTFGKRAEVRARRIMRSGKFAANSPPWVAIKGKHRPLYHTGHLSTMIKSEVKSGYGDDFIIVKLGFPENKPHSDSRSGKGIQDIVEFLISNRAWKPTDASRKAFWSKVPSSFKKDSSVGRKEVWTSPARDFLDTIEKDQGIKNLFMKYLNKASKKAMKKS